MTKQDIIKYVMNTPHNTNKAVLSSMLNQLTDGSGSSDFSTAEVTLANNPDFSGGVPVCSSEDDLEGIKVNALGDGTYTVPLWKGHLYLVLYNTTVSISGNAELIYDGMAVDVYGDCTITKAS